MRRVSKPVKSEDELRKDMTPDELEAYRQRQQQLQADYDKDFKGADKG